MNKVKVALIAALGVAFLSSCGQQGDSKIYNTTSLDRWNKITIEVNWVAANRISEKCKSLGTSDGGPNAAYAGCARSKPDNIEICEVYAVRPRDFDDRDRLMHFGHEVWHCFGAKHD